MEEHEIKCRSFGLETMTGLFMTSLRGHRTIVRSARTRAVIKSTVCRSMLQRWKRSSVTCAGQQVTQESRPAPGGA